MVTPAGPPALLISGLAELSDKITKADKMAIAKMLAVGPSPLLLDIIVKLLMWRMIDFVCPLAIDLFYSYRCIKSYGGSPRIVNTQQQIHFSVYKHNDINIF